MLSAIVFSFLGLKYQSFTNSLIAAVKKLTKEKILEFLIHFSSKFGKSGKRLPKKPHARPAFLKNFIHHSSFFSLNLIFYQ
jgi:hypothetical protein